MTPINNSDTAWLIVCDYNQDNNLYYEELREDILNPEINQYAFEWDIDFKLDYGPDYIGGETIGFIGVGSCVVPFVGDRFPSVGTNCKESNHIGGIQSP